MSIATLMSETISIWWKIHNCNNWAVQYTYSHLCPCHKDIKWEQGYSCTHS